MFSMDIIDTDYFLEMPATTQLLYFHLAMRADDDGFVSSPKRILRLIGSSEDDLKMLLRKEFVIPFDSGVCVIKHWKIHNYIQSDRYNETIYTEEKKQLTIADNKSYEVDTECIQDGYTGKVRLVKESQGKESKDTIPFKEIIDHLNNKTNSHYKHSTPKTKDLIEARHNEGFTLADFKKVIDNKSKEWKGTEFEQYLRPQTLFGTKFESYLNQRVEGSEPKYEEF
jgi:uncharacterized phage protein (TIGR02220 family)